MHILNYRIRKLDGNGNILNDFLNFAKMFSEK